MSPSGNQTHRRQKIYLHHSHTAFLQWFNHARLFRTPLASASLAISVDHSGYPVCDGAKIDCYELDLMQEVDDSTCFSSLVRGMRGHTVGFVSRFVFSQTAVNRSGANKDPGVEFEFVDFPKRDRSEGGGCGERCAQKNWLWLTDEPGWCLPRDQILC